jgi:hypothetical protein
MPEKSSPYAEEGTRAHAMAEKYLTNGATNPMEIPDVDMHNHVLVYVKHIAGLETAGAVLHVEVTVKVTDQTWGTADAIVWDPVSATLYVRDLKYGAGVAVSARGNLQLRIYALAALLAMKYPAKIVDVGIVQPRITDAEGCCIHSVEYDATDLIDFYQDVLEAQEAVRLASIVPASLHDESWQNAYLNPSEKACRWCLAAPKCPKVKAKAQELAKNVFAPTLAYNPKELAETLGWLDLFEGWIKNVRSFAYEEAEAGRVAPGFKLVEKRASRKWKADISVVELVKVIGVPDPYKPAELLPVGDILKLCPGRNNDERSKVLEPFTVKESSGHTLVPDSDKREPVRLDAKAAFSEEKK